MREVHAGSCSAPLWCPKGWRKILLPGAPACRAWGCCRGMGQRQILAVEPVVRSRDDEQAFPRFGIVVLLGELAKIYRLVAVMMCPGKIVQNWPPQSRSPNVQAGVWFP